MRAAINTLRMLSRTCAAVIIFTVLLWVGSTEVSGRSMVKEEEAIKIANQEIDRLSVEWELDLERLDVEVDRGNRRWDEFMSILRISGEVTRVQYQEYQARLQGRTFWTLFYRPKRIDGHGWKGGGATVLIDAKNGEVLLVIPGE